MSEIKLKTKVEIIEETAAFYNLNNRAVKHSSGYGTSCVYLDAETGNKCAVGRCLNPDADVSEYNSGVGAKALFEALGFDILKEEYRIVDSKFWMALQSFHDNRSHWDENGLTQEGIKYKNELIEELTDK